jgi:hypothetical protein
MLQTDRLVPRAPPLAGPGQRLGLTSLPGSPGPKTDMRSTVPPSQASKNWLISSPSHSVEQPWVVK